ncbi:MAG: site-specific DNA-methyltransferase [Planctomycetes bacterium]|nr:site-specific DNA-methyltransferase [Planctomycetota bacterium]
MPSLNFKGKALVQNYHLLVPYHELNPVKSKSLTEKVSLHDNLVVHGDNLKALKALLPYYHGKVKCIYIDPPYNTGNEGWVYNDNVNSPMMQDWLGKVVDREDLTRHDKWLCMMMPRLKLLREMLTDDGIIFVSVDSVEAAHLRILMDEVFGPENFLADAAWEKRYTRSNNAKLFYSLKDTILVYRRSDRTTLLREPRSEKTDGIYRNPDEDPRGEWTSSSYVNPATKAERPNLVYRIKNPHTGKWVEHPTHAWKYSPETHAEHVAEKRLWWGEDGQAKYPRLKVFKSDEGVVPIDVWHYQTTGTTDEGGFSVKEIFGSAVFENPKPVSLVQRMLNLATKPDAHHVVLDCFAGSGTTGHAVLTQNETDGGSRRFVLVESEEYADPVTAERIRRVIKGVPKAKDAALRKGLGGSFSFFEIGAPMEIETILKGDKLPSYQSLAGYVFYTATGEEFDAKAVSRKTGFIGESAQYDVYLFYEPDLDYLRKTALTLDLARDLPKGSGKRRLVFAPTKYLDGIHLDEKRIDFCQLPYEIYKPLKSAKS